VAAVKIEFEIDVNTFKQWRRYTRPRPIVAILVATLMVIGHADLTTMIIGIYFVVGLIVNIEAKWSFVLALITLVSVPLCLILQKPAIANNFAVIAFYFLVCGVVTSLMEGGFKGHCNGSVSRQRFVVPNRGARVDPQTPDRHDPTPDHGAKGSIRQLSGRGLPLREVAGTCLCEEPPLRLIAASPGDEVQELAPGHVDD
jgi:hypothetical protein